MRVLLIHLSDLHYSEKSPIDAQRFKELAAPIPPLLHNRPDLVALLIGGDLVDKGELKSYPAVESLLNEARYSVERNFPDVEVLVATVPGNHDNDFEMDQSARNASIAGIRSGSIGAFSGTLADTLLATQQTFFEVETRLTLSNHGTPLMPSVDRRIAWRHEIGSFPEFGLTCLNSALLSQKHEEQGSLLLPNDIKLGSRQMEVVLVHHPLNWLDAWNSKAIRKLLHSDRRIILTGHEHLADVLQTNLSGAGTAVVVESPPFASANGSERQGYSVVYYDTEGSSHQEFQFFWEEGCYAPYSAGMRIESGQTLLPLATLASSQAPTSKWQFELQFETILDSTELLFSKERIASVRLSDIFEFPDIRELTHQSEYQKTRHVAGEKLCSELLERPIIFVLGPNHSGKTALAKTLMKAFLADGKVPVLSEGKRLPSDEKRYRAHLNELCEEQYGRKQLGLFGNLPLQEKILLIDNYQDSPKKSKLEHRVLKMVNQHCSQVIVFCEETDLGPIDLAQFAVESDLKISVMIIQPMGIPAQRRLVERWLSLDSDLVAKRGEYACRELEAMKLIGGILGKGFVQPFPPYILAVLQSLEAGQPVDVTASTHGHLYEAFIKAALAKRRSLTNHNILTSFVGYLAYWMFRDNCEECSEDYLQERHAEWEELTDLSRTLKSLVDDLVGVRFLRMNEGLYRFGEKFVSYYFTAFFIKDHMNDADVRRVVSDCVQRVWVDDYANVLLFLAHLSRDGSVVDELICEADSYFTEQLPAELSGSIQFGCVDAIAAPESDQDDGGRSHELETVAYEQGLQEMPIRLDRSSGRSDLDYLAKLCAAVKVLQILGQFVKNFPANFTPIKKKEIVEKCIGIGLRTLGSTFDLIDQAKTELLQELAELLSRKGKQTKSEAKREATVALANLCLISSFGLIKRISNAIGSRELEKTYSRVFHGAPDVPSWKLVELSLKLDHAGQFPDGKVVRLYDTFDKADKFAQRLLQQLVARHFRLFEVPYRVRQSTSEHIKIPLKSSLGVGNRDRIVSKPKS
jgi:hypothetical protein